MLKHLLNATSLLKHLSLSFIAVQTLCNTLYGHNYYLTRDEAIQNGPSLEMYKTTGLKTGLTKSSKQVKSAEKSEAPISIQDYAVY